MKKKSLISTVLALVIAMNNIVPAFAETYTTPGKTNTPVEVTTEAMDFSVTVPTSLPVTVSSDGTVQVANNTTIENNSFGPVKVKSIAVTPATGWELISFDTDIDKLSINTKKLGLKLLENKVNTDGTVGLAGFDVINGGESLDLGYSAAVGIFSQDLTADAATITITIGWDEATITGYEIKPPKVDVSELNPEDYGVDYIVEVGSQFYMTGASMYALEGEEDPFEGITWESSDPSVATVGREDGLVTVLTAGYFDITGTVPGLDEPVTAKYGVPDTESGIIPEPAPEVVPYLTFEEETGQEFTFRMNAKNWNGQLYTSTDTENWVEYTNTSMTIDSKNGKLYLRGSNNTHFSTSYSDSTSSRIILSSDKHIKCIGNIETLLDWQTVTNGEHPTIDAYCFYGLFNECNSLTQAPELPATTLTTYCYSKMFRNCTSLTQAPELPATTLANMCYDNMFYNCSSLTQVQNLPATTLASSCYRYMFERCASLTQAPALPATTLAQYCYEGMFRTCISLTQAPELPATTLAYGCYNQMFKECSSLLQAPALPATTLADNCYSFMFSNCKSLTQAPELPATTLRKSCYNDMFFNCTSLVQAPRLPATTLTNYCYGHMFDGCTSLTHIPELTATTVDDGSYSYMFNGCTKIKLSTTQTDEYTIPYRIPKTGSCNNLTGSKTEMFKNTGGTFTGTPTFTYTYYLSNTNSIVE